MKKAIKSLFKKYPGLKLKSKNIAKRLNVREDHEYHKLKSVLHQLVAEDYLAKSGKRYYLNFSPTGKIIGQLMLVKDGRYGFVIPKNYNMRDIFIPERFLHTAFDGDIVEVILLEHKKGKNLEGQITKVIERKRDEIIGTLHKSNSFYYVIADEEIVHRHFYIPENKLKGAKEGDKIVVTNIKWEDPKQNPEGEVAEILGVSGTYDVEIAAIAREFGIEYRFPKKVIKEAEKISDQIPASEIKKRVDLRKETIFTIDPDDAKDFDDAVSVKVLENGNYYLGIHIADVSHFVNENTNIFKEALKRGTSTYLVGKVIPMLPEKLSNNVCSLLPNKDRLTYSVFVEITPRMKIVSSSIKKSIIRSCRRFTYEEVQQIIETGKGDYAEKILLLNSISKKLRNKRIAKGSINFIRPEIKFNLDENGVPLEIKIKEVKESHNLIEELMLLANQIIAETVGKNKNNASYPFIYRIHDVPDRDKLVEFSNFVKSLGYNFDINSASTKQLQLLLEQVKGTEEEAVINEVAIRSMAKAIYSEHNIGHYGLGFKYYTHFTSPIRRFPDLIVHQLIYDYLENQGRARYSLEQVKYFAEHSSDKERDAVQAERLSIKLKQMEYLRNHLGDIFDAVISGITNFGIFIQLSENLAEGLVKLRDMEDDYYIFDEKNYSLVGKSSGKKYRLGDKIRVQLVRIDEERRETDFILF